MDLIYLKENLFWKLHLERLIGNKFSNKNLKCEKNLF